MEEAMEQPTMFTCPACAEEFSTRQQLELHRNETHQRDERATALQLQEAQSQDEERREVF
jgi:uncharacterized Zn ribbon protein